MLVKTIRRRSEFFHSLARYHQAGIHLDRGLYHWAEGLPGQEQKPFHMLAQQLQSGQTLDEAGTRSGVLLPWEARLLAVGYSHGRLDRVLDDLASHHEDATDWWSRLRNRLGFPAAVLLLGWLVLPLPQLFTGQLPFLAYLIQNLLLLAILVFLWRRLTTPGQLHRFLDLVLRLPAISKPVQEYYRYRFLRQLACLYDAGLELRETLDIAVSSCDSPLLRNRWSRITEAVKSGGDISEALHRYQALDNTGYALVLAGEASGRLGDMLNHEARRLEQAVKLRLDGLVDWLPRIAYILVLLLLLNR
jgi:type IV pilus assembly protein PilC